MKHQGWVLQDKEGMFAKNYSKVTSNLGEAMLFLTRQRARAARHQDETPVRVNITISLETR